MGKGTRSEPPLRGARRQLPASGLMVWKSRIYGSGGGARGALDKNCFAKEKKNSALV